jgi:ankyrin repeat protein
LSELLAAVYAGDQARVEELLAGDPELDVFEAAAVGRAERLAELLDAEPGLVSAWAEDGFTPLHLAAFFRRPETARLLVERGALIDVVARNEELQVTPLQSAAAAREEETAALLLERGADPNAQQRGGFTPLHAAAQNGDEPLAELLLAHGASVALAADDGRTAADFARDAGHIELAERLSGR